MRLLMLMVPDDANAVVRIAPTPQTMVGAVSKVGAGATLLIHASSYPLLASLPWWAVSDSVVSLTVYQVIREQGG